MPDAAPDPSASDRPPQAPPRSVWRRLLIGLAVAAALVLVAVAATGTLLYSAATSTPPEYAAQLTELEGLEASGELDTRRQELESQVAALYSDAQAAPRWSLVVTEQQLNGWLTMQLPVDFPKLEEQGLRRPLVLLADGAATLACGVKVRGVDAVASATLSPLVTDEGWLGFELRGIRVGRLPLPAATLAEMFEAAVLAAGATPEELHYRWSESDGVPVLLLDVEWLASSSERLRRVDAIEVRDGELLLSGVTEDRDAAKPAGPGQEAPAPLLPPPSE